MWSANNDKKSIYVICVQHNEIEAFLLIVFVELWEYRDDFKFFLSEILFYNHDYREWEFFPEWYLNQLILCMSLDQPFLWNSLYCHNTYCENDVQSQYLPF